MHFLQIQGTHVQRTCSLDWDRLQLRRVDDPAMDLLFSDEEIHKAVCQLPSEKAPGPDGFPGLFFKICWPIIKGDLVNAIHCFHQLRAGPLEHLNGAHIALIPKGEVAEYAKDFRPISLINSFAKLITKILAIRLSRHIDHLISQSQSAFIKGRCI